MGGRRAAEPRSPDLLGIAHDRRVRADDTDNLMLEHLHGLHNRIEAVQTEMRAAFQEAKHRLTGVESGITGLRRDGLGVREEVWRRQAALDRLDERIGRLG